MSYKFTVELVKGRVKWFYRVRSRNGELMLTSQKYWSKGNAKRAAQAATLNLAAKYQEVQ